MTLSSLWRDATPRRCRVVAVGRTTAALLPVDPPPRERAGESAEEQFMVFEAQRTMVALRGDLETRADDDLRFTPTDGVSLSRRAEPRLDARVEVELRAADVDGVERHVTATVNYSADGVLVEDAGPFREGDAVLVTFSPDDGEPLTARAEAVRHEGQRLALCFGELDADGRRRVADHVVAVKRAALEQALDAVV